MSRTLAACLGIFGLLNCIAGFAHPEWDATIWWIDLRCIPENSGRVLLTAACVLLVSQALFPADGLRRAATALAVLALLGVSLANCIAFYRLIARGSIHTGWPVPLSMFVVCILVWILLGLYRGSAAPAPGWRAAVACGLACIVGFPLAQMFLFGKTDYSRPADAALVFGARAYADGRPSQALFDRVATGCDLYRRGIVQTLIFSGGPGDGAFHETDVMRRIALHQGIPDNAILVDRDGLNTRKSLQNLRGTLGARFAGASPRVLAVSHFYHLPRIKLEALRSGLDVVTVPAKETYPLTKMPVLILREVAALWKYYLVPPI